MRAWRARVEAALEQLFAPSDTEPSRLDTAMRYAVMNGGKRVRPILVYAAGSAVNAPLANLDAPACAIELIHAYSLVHDDLPAMDNDDLRRGQPTCHRKFDEATAILAGDALQALAFEVLSRNTPARQATTQIAQLATLAQASGKLGMAGGQAIDLEAVGQQLELSALQHMHRLKTGALISAAVHMGALAAANTTPDQLKALARYSAALGLAFQIVDDILDVTADTKTLGKPQGSDAARHKPTYPALLGLEESRRRAEENLEIALSCLQNFDAQRSEGLRWIANYVLKRSH